MALDYFGEYKADQRRRQQTMQRARRAAGDSLVRDELTRDRTWGETAADTAVGGLQGAVNLGAGLYGLGNIASLGLLERATGMSDNFDETNEVLSRAKSTQLRWDQQQAMRKFDQGDFLGGIGDYVTNPALLGDLAVTNAASVLPSVGAASWASRAARMYARPGQTAADVAKLATTRGTRAAAGVGGAQMGGNAYVQAYNQAIEEGLSPAEANERAMASGVATGAAGIGISMLPGVGAAGTEAAIGARAAGMGAASRGVARDVATAGARETSEEFLQSGTEQAIQNVASVEREMMDDVATSAVLGGIGGGLLGLGMGAVRAPSKLREDIERATKETGEDLGRSDAATSNLERTGQRAAADDAETIADLLTRAGVEPTDSGLYTVPGDPDMEGVVLSPRQAIDYATSRRIGPTDTGLYTGSADADAEGAVLTPRQANEAEAVAEAASTPGRMRDRVREFIGEPQIVDGQPVYTFDSADAEGNPTVERVNEADAFRLLGAMGVAEQAEVDEAVREVTNRGMQRPADVIPRPRSTDPVTPETALSAEEAADQQAEVERQRQRAQYRREAVEAIRQSGLVMADDGSVFYQANPDGPDGGTIEEFTFQQALEYSGFDSRNVPEGVDLLGDPLTDPAPVEQEIEPGEAVDDPMLANEYQPQLRGLDPLYDVVDKNQRVEAGRLALEALLPPTALPAPSPEAKAAIDWNYAIDRAIELNNERSPDPVNYTTAMRNSGLIRNFISRAVDQGIDPNSAEAFDYIQEQAREAQSDSRAAAKVLGAFADVVGAIAPGTASLPRWRKALIRRRIALSGQMKGPAYAKFKAAVDKAAITPGSAEFDNFMQNFSASLTNAEVDTLFGKKIREAYPYVTPQKAAANKSAQSKPKGKPAAKPRKSSAIKALEKTPQEKAVTEPTETMPEKASPKAKRLNETKKRVKRQVGQNIEQSEVESARVERAANEVRSRVEDGTPPENATGEGPSDAELQALEEESRKQEALVVSKAKPLPQEAVDDINAIVHEAEQRSAARAEVLRRNLVELRNALMGKGATAEERADAWQEAINAQTTMTLETLDIALTKDAADITSWTAITKEIVNSNQIAKYGESGTKLNSVVNPLMEKFLFVINGTQSSDVMRVYRTAFSESGLVSWAEQNLKGNHLASFRKNLSAVNEVVDTAIARQTADPANAANQKPFKTNKGKYSLAPEGDAGTALPLSRVQQIAENYNRANGTRQPVEVVATVAEAQELTGTAVPSAANGMYYNGRAIVIAENVTSQSMAYEVMLHERTHGGLEGLLGTDRLQAVTNRMWANPQVRRRIQSKMGRHNYTRAVAAEEVLVDMAAAGEKLNKSVFSKIRAAVNQFVDVVLGVGDLTVPDSAVNELLSDAANYLRGTKQELNMSESYLQGIDAFMNVAAGSSVPVSPKFSVATSALEEITAGETTDQTRFHRRSQEAMKEGMEQNWKARAHGTATGGAGTIRRFTMDFLPLTQQAALNEGLFLDAEKGDLLKNFSDFKRAKENDFNKTVQDTRTVKYIGADGEKEYTTSPMELAQEWRDVTTKRGQQEQARALNVVNQDGTFFLVHPDRTWDQQSTLDYSKENYTQADRRQAYEKVRAEWNKLSESNKEIYRKAQAMYGSVWQERMNEVTRMNERVALASTAMPDPDNPDAMIRSGEWKKKMDRRVQVAMGRISQGPYSPLQRFGDYYTVIRNPDGQVVFSSGHETQGEAEMMQKSMGDGLEEGYSITTSRRNQFEQSMDGVSLRQLNQMEAALAGVFPGDSPTDRMARQDSIAALREVFLQSQPDHSLLTNANARKNIGGATMDSFRAFNDYMIKSARNLSSMRHDYKIQGALNDMKNYPSTGDSAALNIRRSEVMDAVQRQHLAALQFQSNAISEAMTQTSFMMYMTSPSQLVLNMSQTALVTLPRMAAKYGIGPTVKAIKDGSMGFLRSRTAGMHSESSPLDQNSPMYAVMQSLKGDGTLDFTLTHDISDMAQRGSDLAHSKWREATRSMAIFIHKSEVYNREVAAYATVMGEMQQDGITEQQFAQMSQEDQAAAIERWSNAARKNVIDTQFDYSQSNKAAITQGPYSRVIFQFQQFRQNMLAMMYKDARDAINPPQWLSTQQRREARSQAIKTLSYMTGTQLALTGATGSVLAPVVFGLMGLFDDPDELLSPEQRFLQNHPQWMTMGMVSYGLDPQRFGFNTLMPLIGDQRYLPAGDDATETWDHMLLNSMGAFYGLTSQFASGINYLGAGDYGKAAMEFLPNAFANPIEANVLYRDGRTDRNDIKWYQPTSWDQVMNTLGLKTGDQAAVQADRNAIYSGMTRASDRRSQLTKRWTTAMTPEARSEAYQNIVTWNQRWGRDDSLKISRSTLERAQRTRREKQRIALDTNVPNTRIPEELLRQIND